MATITDRPDVLADRRATPVAGDRFVAGALLAGALVLLAIQGLAGEIIPPLAVFALIYTVLGIAVGRRRSRWLLVAAVLVPLFYLVGSAPFMAANLAHPESPAGFLGEAFVGLASITAAIGAVAGLRGARAGSRRPLALGAGGLAAAAIVIAVVAAAGVESAERQPGDVPVEAVGALFPETVEIAAGGAVLWVDNQDAFHHTLVIEGADVREVLPASSAVRMETDLPAGTYRYFCDVPGHERMEGALVAR